MENSMEVPQETKNTATMWSNNSILGIFSRTYENHGSKGYMHPNFHFSAIYNSQDMEAT